MSKGGGAGKVYFVLYLAVVLELLIIIVERDEAEEHLHKKQKETMRIVESILSQLQSGAGTEGINTRPKDEITIPPSGINLKEVMGADMKSWREYVIEVGVTDVSLDLKKKETETEKEHIQRIEKLVSLANVEKIQYQVFYNNSTDPANAPPFPSADFIMKEGYDFEDMQPGDIITGPDGTAWEFMGLKELKLDQEETFDNLDLTDITADKIQPVYPDDMQIRIGPPFAPNTIPEDSAFYYAKDQSGEIIAASEAENMQKRSFKVNFQPPSQAGWFKLRFDTFTNRILGLKGDMKYDEIDEDATVNIGTVQLAVKDLKKVQKELKRNLEKFDLPSVEEVTVTPDIDNLKAKLQTAKEKAATGENADEVVGNINLYGYIVKLLVPGFSQYFDQNRSNIEFDVRVILPKPKIAKPQLEIPMYYATFDAVEPVFEFAISPYQGGSNVVEGRILDASGNTAARLNLTPLDEMASLNVAIPNNGGKRQYRATTSAPLAPGKYTVEMNHQLMGQNAEGTFELEVFETGLTEASKSNVNTKMLNNAFYGYRPTFTAVPTSGGKIKSNQFRTYIFTDDNPQKPAIEGLTVDMSDIEVLSPESKEVTTRISWIQPLTGREVDLMPEKTYNIKQEQAGITTMNQNVDYSGTAQKVRITITGIKGSKPATGSDQSALVEVENYGDVKLDGLPNYTALEPIISGDSETGYLIEFEIQGKLEPGQRKVSGSATIPLKVTAINPVNRVASEPRVMPLNISIDFTPERKGTGGQQRPDGRRR
jgi:hypothetical protein